MHTNGINIMHLAEYLERCEDAGDIDAMRRAGARLESMQPATARILGRACGAYAHYLTRTDGNGRGLAWNLYTSLWHKAMDANRTHASRTPR